MLTRRALTLGGGAALLGGAGLLALRTQSVAEAAPGTFEVTLSEAEWRQKLSPEAFAVLRGRGTERAFSSPLDAEKRAGAFHCAGCELPLYSSETKFDSGTGWPSFWAPIDGAIGTAEDNTLFTARTEVHCSRCGGHLGHVFEDGPPPTGLRYCMNGVALNFVPA